MIFYIGFQVEFSTKASIAGNMRLLEVQQAAFNKEVTIMMLITVVAVMIVIREVFKKSKWKFKMAFAIRRLAPPPLMAKFPDIFSPHFFSFATESY